MRNLYSAASEILHFHLKDHHIVVPIFLSRSPQADMRQFMSSVFFILSVTRYNLETWLNQPSEGQETVNSNIWLEKIIENIIKIPTTCFKMFSRTLLGGIFLMKSLPPRKKWVDSDRAYITILGLVLGSMSQYNLYCISCCNVDSQQVVHIN